MKRLVILLLISLVIMNLGCEQAQYTHNIEGLWHMDKLIEGGIIRTQKQNKMIGKIGLQFEGNGRLIVYNDSSFQMGAWQIDTIHHKLTLKGLGNHWLGSNWRIISTEKHNGKLILEGIEKPNVTARLTLSPSGFVKETTALAKQMKGSWQLYKTKNAKQIMFSDSLWLHFKQNGKFTAGMLNDTLSTGEVAYNDWYQSIYLRNTGEQSIGYYVTFIGDKLKLTHHEKKSQLYFVKR